MSVVHTAIGKIERNLLTVKDTVTEEDSCRVIATEWFLEDKLVRRDVNVNIFDGLSLEGTQGGV